MGAFVVWENPPSTLATYNESTTSSLQTQATGLSRLRGGKEHCHLLVTCAHYREAGGKGRGEMPRSSSQLPQGGRDKHVALGFTADPAGAPDTHAGGKRPQCGTPDRPVKARGDCRGSASHQAEQVPSAELGSALISVDIYTGPGPGSKGWRPHMQSGRRTGSKVNIESRAGSGQTEFWIMNCIKSSFVLLGTCPREMKTDVHQKKKKTVHLGSQQLRWSEPKARMSPGGFRR